MKTLDDKIVALSPERRERVLAHGQALYAQEMTLESFVYVDDDIASGLALWRPVAESPESVVDESIDFLRIVANEAGITLQGHAPLM